MIADLDRKMRQTTALDSLLTRDEFLRMLGAAKNGKDRAILCMGVIGLRASEMAGANVSWIDWSKRTMTVPSRSAKRGKGRVVPFGKLKVVCDVLLAFFALEPRGLAMSRIAVWGRVKRMASAAGIAHPVTVHGLRASGATFMAQAGYSVTGLCHHFGWSELRTAQHYIAASGASAMRDMEEKGANVL